MEFELINILSYIGQSNMFMELIASTMNATNNLFLSNQKNYLLSEVNQPPAVIIMITPINCVGIGWM